MLHFGTKRWETRDSNTKKRGRIFLGCKDKIYGETNLYASFPISREDLENYKHIKTHTYGFSTKPESIKHPLPSPESVDK